MIDPRRLSVLQAVAVHGSAAGAASALHLSPPAISQQLLAMERETGASLIDGSGRQVRLTAAGRLLAAHGERVAAQLRQAERDLAELTGQASGPAASLPPAEPGLGLRQLAFDPYLLVIPPDWQVRPRSLADLTGWPWVAGPPGTACDHALRRLAAEAGIGIPAGDA